VEPLVTFRLGMQGISTEDFLARTADPTVIAEAKAQLALPEGGRRRHITGPIQRITMGQNLGWSWQHIDSEWQFAQISVEVCDARPSYVEANLDDWLRKVGRFCPWSCHIKGEGP
jgi:hypothetical protein